MWVRLQRIRELRCGLAVVSIGLAVLASLLILRGHLVLSYERNTSTTGKLLSFHQLAFSHCFAKVQYLKDSTLEPVERDIFVPCQPVLVDNGTLPINLCYNLWQPDNIQFDDRNTASQGWHLCSDFTHQGGRGLVLLGLGIASFSVVVWLPYLCILMSLRSNS